LHHVNHTLPSITHTVPSINPTLPSVGLLVGAKGVVHVPGQVDADVGDTQDGSVHVNQPVHQTSVPRLHHTTHDKTGHDSQQNRPNRWGDVRLCS